MIPGSSIHVSISVVGLWAFERVVERVSSILYVLAAARNIGVHEGFESMKWTSTDKFHRFQWPSMRPGWAKRSEDVPGRLTNEPSQCEPKPKSST